MSFRIDTLVAAGILGALLLAGSVMTAHAGDGCDKDKEDGMTTSSLWTSPAAADLRRL
jgi:hypothetical protein